MKKFLATTFTVAALAGVGVATAGSASAGTTSPTCAKLAQQQQRQTDRGNYDAAGLLAAEQVRLGCPVVVA